MLEKWKLSLDKGKVFGDPLTDHSKAFDYLSHQLITLISNAYGFSLPYLNLCTTAL